MNNKKIEEIVRQITDDIWREMSATAPFKMDYVAEVLRQALTAQRQEVIEMCETELKNNMITQDEPVEAEAYRQAITDIITKLKTN